MPLSNIFRHRTLTTDELRGLNPQTQSFARSISSDEPLRPAEIRQVSETQEPTRTMPTPIEVQVEIGDSINDIDRKYMHCYLLHDNDLWNVVGVVEGNSREGIKLDIFNFKRNIRIQIPYTSHAQFTHPKLGYINFEKHALFFERTHKRSNNKYKRGFYPNNVLIHSISDRELKSCYGEYNTDPLRYLPSDIIKRIGSDMYLREYPSYDEAIKLMTSFERLSCALSSSICLQLNSYSNKFMLFKNKWIIGEFDLKRKVWSVYNTLFIEDLNNLNIPFEVNKSEE